VNVAVHGLHTEPEVSGNLFAAHIVAEKENYFLLAAGELHLLLGP
jgi:hypothetical protein